MDLLKCVQAQTIRYRLDDTKPILLNQYHPVVFEDFVFSIVDVTVSCILVQKEFIGQQAEPMPQITAPAPASESEARLKRLPLDKSDTSVETSETLKHLFDQLLIWSRLETRIRESWSQFKEVLDDPKLSQVQHVFTLLGTTFGFSEPNMEEMHEPFTDSKWIRRRIYERINEWKVRSDPLGDSYVREKLNMCIKNVQSHVLRFWKYWQYNFTILVMVKLLHARKAYMISQFCEDINIPISKQLKCLIPLHDFDETSPLSSLGDLDIPDLVQMVPLHEELVPRPFDTQVQSEQLLEMLSGPSKRHLIVFVHGFQGTQHDFRQYHDRLIKTMVLFGLDRDSLSFLFSSVNAKNTLGDIEGMGQALALEIANFYQTIAEDEPRISFVAHSLGGLIVRAAIKQPPMESLRPRLHGFTTFGTPHLGIPSDSNVALSSVLGLYQVVARSKCIEQLYLRDHSDPTQCYLYGLAQDESISSFKRVTLFGSIQDRYSPLFSALAFSKEGGFHQMYTKLSTNQPNIERVSIHFQSLHDESFSIRGLFDPNIILGRNGHVAMLESYVCIDMCIATDLPQFLI